MRNAMAKKTAGLNIIFIQNGKGRRAIRNRYWKEACRVDHIQKGKRWKSDVKRCGTVDCKVQGETLLETGGRDWRGWRKLMNWMQAMLEVCLVRVHNGVWCDPRGLLREHELQRIHPWNKQESAWSKLNSGWGHGGCRLSDYESMLFFWAIDWLTGLGCF